MATSETPIFVNESGRSVALFLETGSVRDRSKLVRKILKHGGVIVHEALKADILIAEGDSKEVQTFIEAWGKDKVILDTRWIHHCLKAGRFIGDAQSWGGCDLRLLVSFNDQEEEEELEEEKGEEEDQDQDQMRISRAAFSNKPPQERSSHTNIKIEDSPPPTKKRRLEEFPNTIPPQQAGTPSHNPHVFQTLPPGPSSQTYETSPPYNPSQSAPAFPPSSQDIFTTLGHEILSSPQFAPLLSTAIQHILAQENPNQGIISQLKDIVALNGTPNPSSQPYSQMPPSTQPPTFNSSNSDTSVPNPPSPISDHQAESESTVVIQKFPHRAGSLSSIVPSSDDDVQRALRTLPSVKKRSENGNNASLSQSEGFFTTSAGTRFMFYLDMRLKNRKELINIVKKNGGVIVTAMNAADYVILNERSPEFAQTAAAVPLDKTVVSVKWLNECSQAGRLIPEEDYRIEVTSSSSKRRRDKSTGASQSTISTNHGRESGEPERSSRKPTSPRKVKPPPPPPPSSSSSQPMRSPSPPAHIEAYSDHANLFTQGDKDWLLRYVRYKWQQDPQTSLNALLNAITRKAPHHTKASWRNAYTVKWAAEVQAIQDEMNILR